MKKRIPGSYAPADTSFTIVAPAFNASEATTAFLVSMDIGTPMPSPLVNARITGITRSNCSSAGMGLAPGLYVSEINETSQIRNEY